MIEVLKTLSDFGVDEAIEEKPINRYKHPASEPPKKVNQTPNNIQNPARKIQSPTNTAMETLKIAKSCNDTEQLRKAIESFKGISITKTATNTVFCDGVREAQVMLIGEAPGADEDAKGIPFCGASGQLLDKMLIHIGLSRQKNFYITNTLFWRPPGNRRPTPEELDICRPFVEKHIALIKPKLIILVGGTAITSVLQSKQTITKIRGQFFDYNNQFLDETIKTTAIFHPSYLLRSPGQKKNAWHDCLTIKKHIIENGIKI
jgi:uracil-DNA glycosylase family 4